MAHRRLLLRQLAAMAWPGGPAAAALAAAGPARAAPPVSRSAEVPFAPLAPVAQPAPPAADPATWRLGADFEPLSAVWLSFDAGHAALTAGLVATLRDHVGLRFLVPDDATREQALQSLGEHEIAPRGLEFVVEPLASFFLRDMAVFARTGTGPGGLAGVVDFRWTQYGMAAWCRGRYADAELALECTESADLTREDLDRAIARHLDVPTLASPLAVEGGGFETNGEGVVIANEALYRSRNPETDLAGMEAQLLRLPGVKKVIWLPAGLAEDPHLRASIVAGRVAWGTGGHTDEFVRFADARTVLLAWPEDGDAAAHPVARLTRRRMQRNAEILAAATTADGTPLRVLKVPQPRPIERRVFLSHHGDPSRSAEWSPTYFPPGERRRAGQPVQQVATASYLNFVVANDVVVLPDYRRHGTPADRQERVRRVFERAFPGRRVAFVDAITANWVGGGLHCATLSQP